MAASGLPELIAGGALTLVGYFGFVAVMGGRMVLLLKDAPHNPVSLPSTLYWPDSPKTPFQRRLRRLLLSPAGRFAFAGGSTWMVPAHVPTMNADACVGRPKSGWQAQFGPIITGHKGPEVELDRDGVVHVRAARRSLFNTLAPFAVPINLAGSGAACGSGERIAGTERCLAEADG